MPKIVCFSGAGLSAESGVPTFRDADGLWEGHRHEDVADLRTWRRNRDLVFKFYNARRIALEGVEPNAAHRMLAGWQQDFECHVLTQNVDDLCERGGCTSVVHLHGEITKLRCCDPTCGAVWDIGYTAWSADKPCPSCGSARDATDVKPFVVFFHEEAPEYERMYSLINSLTDEDCVVVIGTSGAVLPFQSLLHGEPGYKILCNLEPLESEYWDNMLFDKVVYGKAAAESEQVDRAVRSWMSRSKRQIVETYLDRP
jgi:NAD-dependent deacetylase